MELTSLESLIATLLRQPRVFLAEDDDEMRAFAYWTLREEGYDVVEAADGRQMLDRMRAVFGGSIARPDVIVTDLRMPGCSGLEVLAVIRRAGLRIPVILMTAFGDEALHSRAREFGATRVLDKPFDADHLREAVVDAHLDHMRSRIHSPAVDVTRD